MGHRRRPAVTTTMRPAQSILGIEAPDMVVSVRSHGAERTHRLCLRGVIRLVRSHVRHFAILHRPTRDLPDEDLYPLQCGELTLRKFLLTVRVRGHLTCLHDH